MISILLVEDDNALAMELASFLKENNYSVDWAENGKAATHLIGSNHYDLCLLDIGLPDCSGFELCKTFRAWFHNPIIMLTACDSEDNIVNGLEVGADDYVTKPCSLRILHSRITSQLRRKKWDDRQELKSLLSGELLIDILHRTISCNGEVLSISNTEYELCVVLAKSDGQIMPRELLLDRIWDVRGQFIDDNTLSVHVSRLRKKLGLYCDKSYIETIKGIGYRWNFMVVGKCHENTI
ncbi:response regulator transcription factor [Parasporobacterium paucivorans]|uniref:Stage 0 sporulation protein A homolog n=1 Tax=Parasporobacterium paucivorans DSM 15970 TaxID=1122934 RepID=A0A1M6KPU6_9FIRM|nr:response regulator transcription factor [Parasporobacterium paucivorans]SHJ60922.1 DNA-binding response regulator, OmpR family, contains REC and winged-helix (wHTH) domain [Parasporobacterium paucivorans DSM 15970]